MWAPGASAAASTPPTPRSRGSSPAASRRGWGVMEGGGAAGAGAGRGAGPGDGPGEKRKWKRKPARAEQMLAGRLEARARLDALRDKDQDRARAGQDARIAELAARVQRKEDALRKWEAEALARTSRHAAAAAAGRRPGGRAPRPAEDDRDVKRARGTPEEARAAHAAALAGQEPPA